MAVEGNSLFPWQGLTVKVSPAPVPNHDYYLQVVNQDI